MVMAAFANDLSPAIDAQRRFNRPMILLDDVVQIFAGPHFDVTPARMFSAQQP
jgi:hypothetical protein